MWSKYADIDAEELAMSGGFDLRNPCPKCGAAPLGSGDGLGRSCIECGWEWVIGRRGGRFELMHVQVGRGWQIYARALITAMRGVLEETDDRQRELMLEVADYWLGLGVLIGLERKEQGESLLGRIAKDSADWSELRKDADDLLEKALP